jgi:hypothetical protein
MQRAHLKKAAGCIRITCLLEICARVQKDAQSHAYPLPKHTHIQNPRAHLHPHTHTYTHTHTQRHTHTKTHTHTHTHTQIHTRTHTRTCTGHGLNCDAQTAAQCDRAEAATQGKGALGRGWEPLDQVCESSSSAATKSWVF